MKKIRRFLGKVDNCLLSVLLIYIALTLGVIFALAALGFKGITFFFIELASIQPFIKNIYVPLCKSNYYKEKLAKEEACSKLLMAKCIELRQQLIVEKNITNNLKQNIFQSSVINSRNIGDIVDAVRYAMNKSHPDNGGKAEEFIKYKKLYDKLKR